MKPKRKKIVKLGWGVKWQSGQIEFYHTKKKALDEIEYFFGSDSVLFRYKIEEVTK